MNANTTLKDLISIPSMNNMDTKIKPEEGYGEKGVCEYIELFLQKHCIPYERQNVLDGRDNIIACFNTNKRKKTIVLQSHMDTVPVSSKNMFNPKENDKFIYGRGSCDAKASLASMLEALVKYKDSRGNRIYNIIFAGVVDEEYLHRGVDKLLENKLVKNAAFGIVGEPTSLNIANNIKGLVRWKIITRGKSVHSSEPEKGDNAIYKMAEIVSLIKKYEREILNQKIRTDMGIPTISVGIIKGGTAVNMVPDRCEIEIDRRLLINEDPLNVVQEINSYIKAKSNIEFKSEPPYNIDYPQHIDKKEQIIKIAEKACKKILGHSTVMTANFACDATKMTRKGILQ